MTKARETTLKLEFDLPIGKLTSYTGYSRQRNAARFDFDGTYADLGYSDFEVKHSTKQQSLDLAIDAIEGVDLVIGGMYLDDRYSPDRARGQAEAFGANMVLAARTGRALKTKAYAAFIDAVVQVTDGLFLGAGGRYTKDDRWVAQAGTNIASVSANTSFKRFTPRVTARYEVGPQSNIYASFSKGFRSGSCNAVSNPNPVLAVIPVKPEGIKAYEIGYKTAQSIFRADVSAFYYDYKNLQVSLTVPNPLGLQFGVISLLGNAPKAEVYGLDFKFDVEPVEDLHLSLGGVYLHARYRDFVNAVGTGVDATNTVNVTNQTQDWSDQQMARALRFSGNVAVDYTTEAAGGSLLLSGNVRYVFSPNM